MMVVQRANETEDQSLENLAAIESIFMEVAENSDIVLDQMVSLCIVQSSSMLGLLAYIIPMPTTFSVTRRKVTGPGM